ncbi:RcnB family protein [Lysobacter olei]
MKRTLGSILALSMLMSGVAAAGAHDDRRGDDRYDRYGRYDRDDDRHDRYRYDRDDDRDHRHHRHDRGRKVGHYKHRRHPHYVAYRRGYHMHPEYRGYVVNDYYRYGLYAPPRHHEWRRMDDRYVLVSVATGIISAVILNSL